MWTMNFSGTKSDIKTKHDQVKKTLTTDSGDAAVVWPLVNHLIGKKTIRDSQTIDVAVSGGNVDATGRFALSINIVVT